MPSAPGQHPPTPAAPGPPEHPPNPANPPDPPPYFDVLFALVLGVISVVLIVLGLAVLGPFHNGLRLSDTEWKALTPQLQIATRLLVPIAALGAIAVIVGMWMAAVEWRGRFSTDKPALQSKASQQARDSLAAEAPAGAPAVLSSVIESAGKLRGAALVMIVGALLMGSAAWIAQSAAGTPPAATSTTTTTK